MNKYLIFRTDRLGDFLITAILIRSIKRNDPSSYIIVVASKNNYDYIKTFDFVNEVILFKKSILSRIKIIIKLLKNSYKSVIVHDSKKRSKFISYFLKENITINIDNTLGNTHIKNVELILKKLNFEFIHDDLNILDNRIYENSINFNGNYIVIHFDEKWIHNKYILSYINIEPNEEQLVSFLNSIVDRTNKKILITTGKQSPKILNKIFLKNINPKIKFLDNLNFYQVEKVISNCDLLISCHGAVSHICSAKNIPQIDIIDPSYKYSLWTDHFRKYTSINRSSFIELSRTILNFL